MSSKYTFLKPYAPFLILLLFNSLLLFFNLDLGVRSFTITGKNFLEMLGIIPPIFILLGLLDVWVERETMVRFMGEDSGWLGVSIAFVLGTAAAGPLYAAFPIATLFLKKGARFRNVLIFIGAWATTKIPLLLFEASSLGLRFALLRLCWNLPVIALTAYIIEKMLSGSEKEQLQQA